VADFLQAVGKKEQASPTFADALATEYVTDAVLKSAKTRQWEKVEEA
jgi:predicted dehydrogenase